MENILAIIILSTFSFQVLSGIILSLAGQKDNIKDVILITITQVIQVLSSIVLAVLVVT